MSSGARRNQHYHYPTSDINRILAAVEAGATLTIYSQRWRPIIRPSDTATNRGNLPETATSSARSGCTTSGDESTNRRAETLESLRVVRDSLSD